MSVEVLLNLVPWTIGLALGMVFFMGWQRDRQFDREMRRREFEIQQQRALEEEKRRAEDEKRREEEKSEARWEKLELERKAKEEAVRTQAGMGSGGFIVIDLPDAQRGLFHDLLKGFEEYARLKGYGVSFSIDSTFPDRIAFKFTLTDPDVVVANDRVRKDLKEYLEKVSRGDPLDDMPKVVSIEEHEILVTTLRNRISFLQHSYNLAKNSVEFYEGLIRRASSQPFLPAPSIVVQTGGAYNAQSYSALNSPQALIGVGNEADNSLRIAITYRERKEQIDRLAELLEKLRTEAASTDRDEAVRNLGNVKEELEQSGAPDPSRVQKWLTRAKEAIQFGSLGRETVQAARELFKLFGVG